MNISNETLEILKNFSTINAGIVVEAGTKKLKTIAIAKNIIADADIEEDFPSDFAIYDLNQFLNTISLFDNPTFEFGEKSVTISSPNGGSCRYVFADASLIVTTDKSVALPQVDVEFVFTNETLQQLTKAAATLGLPDLVVEPKDGKIVTRVLDKSNDSTNTYDIEVGDYDGDTDFSFHFKTENLKIIPQDYTVSVTGGKISSFKNDDGSLEYFIALESSSTFG